MQARLLRICRRLVPGRAAAHHAGSQGAGRARPPPHAAAAGGRVDGLGGVLRGCRCRLCELCTGRCILLPGKLAIRHVTGVRSSETHLGRSMSQIFSTPILGICVRVDQRWLQRLCVHPRLL